MQPTWGDRVSRVVLFAVEMAADLTEDLRQCRESKGPPLPGTDRETVDLADIQPQLLHLLANWPAQRSAERARRALIYWLDDLFTTPGWTGAAAWLANSLEQQLLGSSHGPTAFLTLAETARETNDLPALGVCALCLRLGFRGDHFQTVAKTVEDHMAHVSTVHTARNRTAGESVDLGEWASQVFPHEPALIRNLPARPLLRTRRRRPVRDWWHAGNHRWLWTITGTAGLLAVVGWLTSGWQR